MAQDLVNDLEISCPNITAEDKALAEARFAKASLCKWSGKVRDEQMHCSTCSFQRVPCGWAGCSLKVRLDELQLHMSQHDLQACPHCHVLYPSRSLQDASSISTLTPGAAAAAGGVAGVGGGGLLLAQHAEQCSKRPQKCPNAGCETTHVGEEMAAHRQNCELEIVPCTYAELGCKHTARRSEVQAHANDMALHFQILLNSMVQTRAQVTSLSHSLMHTQIELECLKLLQSDQHERFTTGYFYWQLPASTPLHLNNPVLEANSPSPPPGQQAVLAHVFRSVPGKIGENSFSLWLQVNKTITASPSAPPTSTGTSAPQPSSPGTIGLFVCLDNGASLPPNRHCSIKAKVRVNSLSPAGVRTLIQDCQVIVGDVRPPNFTIGRQYSTARPDFMPSYETMLEVLARGDTLEFGTFVRYEMV